MRSCFVMLASLLLACGGHSDIAGSGGAKGSASSSSSSSSSASATTGAGGFDNTPECTSADQCVLCNDCCSCLGAPASEGCPACPDVECFAPMCSAMGFPTATPQCAAGRCVAGFVCDYSMVVCAQPPPPCEPGKTASVLNGCWGGCVPTTQCASVADCSQCDPATQVCVQEVAFEITSHCVDKPSACQGKPLCACMGASACVNPFNLCSDVSSSQISCGCPTC